MATPLDAKIEANFWKAVHEWRWFHSMEAPEMLLERDCCDDARKAFEHYSAGRLTDAHFNWSEHRKHRPHRLQEHIDSLKTDLEKAVQSLTQKAAGEK